MLLSRVLAVRKTIWFLQGPIIDVLRSRPQSRDDFKLFLFCRRVVEREIALSPESGCSWVSLDLGGVFLLAERAQVGTRRKISPAKMRRHRGCWWELV